MTKQVLNARRASMRPAVPPTVRAAPPPPPAGPAPSNALTAEPRPSTSAAAQRRIDNMRADQPRRGRPGRTNRNVSSDRCPMSYEDIQKIIGVNGFWQLKIFLLAAYSGFCTAHHNLIYGFIGVAPEHWCNHTLIPGNYTNREFNEKLTTGMSDNDRSCQYYAWSWDNSTQFLSVDNTSIYKCTSYEYDHSEFESTVPSDFDMVCDYEMWVPYIQVTYMAGLLAGAPMFGALSDNKGRKIAILVANVVFTVAGPSIAYAPDYPTFMLLRFILALALPGVYACAYVLAIEIVSERWRSIAGNVFNVPFATGYTVLPIVAYYVRSWRTLQLIVSAPSALLIGFWYLLPESPRWLIRRGRLTEAELILRNAAKVNKREDKIPDNFREIIKAIYDNEKISDRDATFWGGCQKAMNDYCAIIRSPRMRWLFLLMCCNWGIIGMSYYGLGLNADNLSTDKYTYVFINGLLEFPGYLMVPFFIKYYGRKPVFIGFMWTCGGALLLSLGLPKGSLLIVLLSFLGKLAIGANYSLAYLYSAEMLPTLVRNCALGICSMSGRLGSTLAPFIVDFAAQLHHRVPTGIFGLLAVLAGLISLWLPETQDRRLPETIDEVEKGTGVVRPSTQEDGEGDGAIPMLARTVIVEEPEEDSDDD